MRISVVWDWPPVLSQVSTWADGLAAAIRELQTRHDVQVFMPGDKPGEIDHPYFPIRVSNNLVPVIADYNPDVILIWADMTRPNAIPLFEKLHKPMAICFAGGDPLGENAPLFDHIFVESQVYKDRLNAAGYENVSIAFGTNTDLFTPLPEQNKQFATILPATFAAWKRHDLYAHATMGLRSLAVGYMYDTHEQECWQECLKLGTTILPHVSAQVLRYLYAASRICVIPSRSDGGSQRTVLEAMAMNLPLIITDSDKFDYALDSGKVFVAEPTVESIRGYIDAILDGEQEVNTRDYVLEHWSHLKYAEALEDGLKQIV